MKKIKLPLTKEAIKKLKVGDMVLISGPLLTGRDQAHKRLVDTLRSKKKLPISLNGETIYYTGPTPSKKLEVIGSCGPTTSARMDTFLPLLLKRGLLGMIGKGERSKETGVLIKKYNAVYFVTVGGAGAYLQSKVKKNTIIAYRDLQTEAIRRLIVKDFPAIVAIK